MNLDFLRRWLGETRTMQTLRLDLCDAELRALQHQINYLRLRRLLRSNETRYARVDDLNAVLAAANRAHLNDMALLLEPVKAVRCDKTRLRDADEAAEWARRTETAKNLAAGTLTGYDCHDCPRHPLTLERYWHVTNVDVDLRGNRSNPKRGQRPPRLLSHATPGDIARLKAKTQGGHHG